jgi:hypothetical protein
MKRFLFGVFVGYQAHKIKITKKYIDENPDDPKVVEMKEKFAVVKASFAHANEVTKQSWQNAKTKLEFDKIVSHNKMK